MTLTLREALQGPQLPSWFEESEGYAKHQYCVGWTLRQQTAPREKGDVPGFTVHPDAGKNWTDLKPGVRLFVSWIGQWQVRMFIGLGKEKLHALREAGRSQQVPEELTEDVRARHHKMWMASRDSFELFGLGTVAQHESHKAEYLMHSLELPKQRTQNGAQVLGYAVMLAAMPDEHFTALIDAAA
jgi:hypothetical protein